MNELRNKLNVTYQSVGNVLIIDDVIKLGQELEFILL